MLCSERRRLGDAKLMPKAVQQVPIVVHFQEAVDINKYNVQNRQIKSSGRPIAVRVAMGTPQGTLTST